MNPSIPCHKEEGGVAVLWTGGKDSCLALHASARSGRTPRLLATFIPTRADFKAHPLPVLRQQACALGLPLLEIPIEPPFDAGYRRSIERLRDEHAIGLLVTGDIDLVDGQPNWIHECCAGTGVETSFPLWRADRRALLDQLIVDDYHAIISLIRSPLIPADWIGRSLDAVCVSELLALADSEGIDPCGENGEFHTLVLSAPRFTRRVCIEACEPRALEDYHYLWIGDSSLAPIDERGGSLGMNKRVVDLHQPV